MEITVGDSSQNIKFGDPQEEKYWGFWYDTFRFKHMMKGLKFANGHVTDREDCHYAHVKLAGVGEETVGIKFNLFYPGETEITQNPDMALPDSLKSSSYLSDLTMKIMKDASTTDLKITCGEKDNKKIFHVHKNFFCARSPVFRAAVETDMLEGRTKEIYIEEVDPVTLQEMISYIYTGDFTVLADKYILPGMMDLLCFRMKDVEDENIADMLIAAGNISVETTYIEIILLISVGRHGSQKLTRIAMNKIRNQREILSNPAFRRKFEGHQNFLFDLCQDM